MNLRLLLLLALSSLVLALAACGDDDEESASGEPAATQAETAAAEEPAEISKDLETKPEIGKPAGEPPSELVKEDVVVGKGPAAKEGDQVTVHYVGVNFSTGDQFDASWDRGEPTSFQLAKGQLIDGWVQGMKGMKVGGRRKLVIPPHLAYGDRGAGGVIGPGETLIFVVDLVEVR